MQDILHIGRRPGISTLVIVAALLLLPVVAPAAQHHPSRRSDVPTTQAKATRVGLASYYGKGFNGKKTASGEVFDKTEMVAAHPSYPVGTRARVTNLRNGRSEEVRIIDRGPTRENQYEGVIIDVSEGVATSLGFRKKGRARVKVEVLEWGEKQAKLGSPR